MNGALEKTLALLFFILLGVLIRTKFKNRDQVNGIKQLILTIALPATIFVALMGVQVSREMLVYPILAIVFNLVLYFITPTLLKLFGIGINSPQGRTLRLLLPSLAPGLSCFPFIKEFLGDSELAIAALADVGNKVFVLLFLYLIAMNMFLSQHPNKSQEGKNEKVKSLLLSLVREPINIVLFIALSFIIAGVQLSDLPVFLSTAFERMGQMMTPMVLLFIGIAVTVRKKLLPIFSLLLSRAGIAMATAGVMIWITGVQEQSIMLLCIAFGLSSCSFWPFAHMATFDQKEEEMNSKRSTFDISFGLLVLAISLPVSTLLVLAVLNSGALLTSPGASVLGGFILILIGVLPIGLMKLKNLIKLKPTTELKPRLETAD